MEAIFFEKMDWNTVCTLMEYGQQRYTLAKEMQEYFMKKYKNQSIEFLESVRITKELQRSNCIGLKEFNDGRIVPLGMFINKVRFDPVWLYMYNTFFISEWEGIFREKYAEENGTSISYLKIKVPHVNEGKEFFEPDVSAVFKKFRKLSAGWKRAIKHGSFYTSIEMNGEKVFIVIRCVVSHESKIKSEAIVRFTNYFLNKMLGIKSINNTFSFPQKNAQELATSNQGITSEKSVFLEGYTTDCFKKSNGKWNIELIEKLIERKNTAIPKVHQFGK